MAFSLAALAWPPRYIFASIIAGLGGFLLGIDTSIIGPVTIMPAWVQYFGNQTPTVHGTIVSEILLSASVTSFIAGRPADVFGRPRAIAFGIGVFALGTALEAGSINLAMFICGRFIEGAGFGLYFGNLTVYVCEISPPHLRGPLTTGPQFCVCLGLLVGYFISFGTGRIAGNMSWRTPFIILSALSICLIVLTIAFVPQSPRWLRLNGRSAEAEKMWDLLGVRVQDREKIEESLNGASHQPAEAPHASGMSEKEPSSAMTSDTDMPGGAEMGRATTQRTTKGDDVSFWDLFRRDVQSRTMFAFGLMGALQLSGVDAVLYYAPLLFKQAGIADQEAAFLASGVSGIVLLVVSVPALLFADKWGRRTSTLVGGVGLTVTMLLMGALYAADLPAKGNAPARWIIIICIYLYSAFFASSWAVSIKVYAPEIQPQRTRAKAIALAHGSNWVCNFFVAFITPVLLDRSASATYWLFGACNLITTVCCFFFMIETKGKTLEEIEAEFSQGMVRHALPCARKRK